MNARTKGILIGLILGMAVAHLYMRSQDQGKVRPA